MTEKQARQIIERISGRAIQLAVLRHMLENDEGITLDVGDEQVEDIKRDVLNVMTGDDLGCADESDLTPETCERLWLENLKIVG